MDQRKLLFDYQQFSYKQLLKIRKIIALIALIILFYYIYSDIYYREMPTWAMSRIAPIVLISIFFILSFTRLVKEKPIILLAFYYAICLALLGMSYSIAIIAWNTDKIQVSVTALIVVSMAIFITFRGSVYVLMVTYLVPSFIFVLYIFLFTLEPSKLADFANSFVVILWLIVIYHFNEKLRKNRFFAEMELTVANQSLNKMTEELQLQNSELQDALTKVKLLSGLLPICSHCKKIRDDKGYWNQIESYIHRHSEAEFSHGICPECAKELYPEFDLYPET